MYSDYKEYDLESDTENITNLDNQTGYDYNNEYVPSGHILKIRAKSVPVKGQFDKVTKAMTLTKLSEENYKQFPDGSAFDNTDALGEGYDCFIYIPNFYYKGINDFKRQEGSTHFCLPLSLSRKPHGRRRRRVSCLSSFMLIFGNTHWQHKRGRYFLR